MIPNLHERLIKLQSYVKLRLNPDAFYNSQLVDEEIFTLLQRLIDECNSTLFYGPIVYPTFVPEAWMTPTPEPKLWLKDQHVEELEKSHEQEDRVAISIIRRNLQHAKREYARIEFDLHYREEEFAKMYPQPNDVEDHQLDSRRV